MQLLLDTHIALWLLSDSKELSQKARSLLQNKNNQLRISVISLIEIQIKQQLGKLQLAVSIEQLISEWQSFGIKLLPLLPAHSQAFSTISLPHKDPFDKLLLASAAAGPMYLLTADQKLQGASDLVLAA